VWAAECAETLLCFGIIHRVRIVLIKRLKRGW
jgi:hypothetical protein